MNEETARVLVTKGGPQSHAFDKSGKPDDVLIGSIVGPCNGPLAGGFCRAVAAVAAVAAQGPKRWPLKTHLKFGGPVWAPAGKTRKEVRAGLPARAGKGPSEFNYGCSL